MQPAPGPLDFCQTAGTVTNARSRGWFVFATLAYTPGWANGGQPWQVPPSNMQDWYNFVFCVVQHYQGVNMDVWQFGIWNEPNLPGFYQGTFSQYIDLVNTGRRAIKDANAGATVLGPEVSWHGVRDGWYSSAMTAVGSAFDIVTVHWYPDAWKPLWDFMDNDVRPWSQGRSVWLTEVGQQTCSEPFGENNQASLYGAVLGTFQPRRGWFTTVLFYDLYETPECSWAIVRPDLFRRQAVYTYQSCILDPP